MLGEVNEYEPTKRSFDRFYRLAVRADVPREKVAAAVADGIARDRQHVRLPAWAALFPMMTEAPRRVVELALVGVSRS